MAKLDRPYTKETSTSSADKGRRSYPRHNCRLEAQVRDADSWVRMKGVVTDLSISGCYVEMLSPLPINAEAEIVFSVASSTLNIRARVSNSQPGLGMGVEFIEMGSRGREDVHRLIERGPEKSEVSRPPEQARVADMPTATALEAIVRILLRKGVVTQEELAQEYKRIEDLRPT